MKLTTLALLLTGTIGAASAYADAPILGSRCDIQAGASLRAYADQLAHNYPKQDPAIRAAMVVSYLSGQDCAADFPLARIQKDFEDLNSMTADQANRALTGRNGYTVADLEQSIANVLGRTTSTPTPLPTGEHVAAPATKVSAKLAVDVTFDSYDGCTAKMTSLGENVDGTYTNGSDNNLQIIDDVKKYCRGLFPETGGLEPAPAPNDREKYAAGKAFVDAFGALIKAKQQGVSGAELEALINTCQKTKDNARGFGVVVDDHGWDCE